MKVAQKYVRSFKSTKVLTLPRVMGLGFVLGVMFSLGALIADELTRARLPHVDVFLDPAQFLNSLHK